LNKPRRSNSFLTDNEDTPQPLQRYGVKTSATAKAFKMESSLLSAHSTLARKNSVADTKTSKFREEFSPSPPKKRLLQSSSIIKFMNPKRLSMRSQSDTSLQPEAPSLAMDGAFDTLPVPADRERRQSRSLVSMQAEQEALGKNKDANPVWDQALQTHQQEKVALFLPKNKDLAVHSSPFRERSGSVSTRRYSAEEDLGPTASVRQNSRRSSAVVPGSQKSSQQGPEDPHASVTRRSALTGLDDTIAGQDVLSTYEKQGDCPEVVGAWGRYPSHTRLERTSSAGKVDRVEARDFALEAAIKFASANEARHDDELIDPTQLRPSPTLLPGEKTKKKRIGSARVPRSSSMTFGKTLLKNYTKMFKSQSTEFQKHGRGHRSSIASGGILEHPELELLPGVWAGDSVRGGTTDSRKLSSEHIAQGNNHQSNIANGNGKGKLPVQDSMATLRPRRNSSAPNLNDMSLQDGSNDPGHAQDRARVWSVYYENCVNSFPRLSADGNLGLEDFDSPFASKRTSQHSRTLPARLKHHSHNTSNASRGKSFVLASTDDVFTDKKSLGSVRRSTMDLISKFKEQEATEHDKILALSRMEIGGFANRASTETVHRLH
jgi:hypothetical protein